MSRRHKRGVVHIFMHRCSRCKKPMDQANLLQVSGLHPLDSMPNPNGIAYGRLELCFGCWNEFDDFLKSGCRKTVAQ